MSLMALGKVPEAVPGDQQEVAPAVGDQAAGRAHLLELRTQAAVSLLLVVRGDVDAGKGILHLEHPHEGMDVQLLPEVELDRVRVRKSLVSGTADGDASFLEVYLVHNICYICRIQR